LPYQHSEDIDETRSSFIPRLNEQMTTCVYRIVAAIDNHPNLDSEFKSAVTLVLKSTLFTHKSITVLLRHGNEEKYDPDAGKDKDVPSTDMTLSADAMSLVREQLEKVFVVALLCDDPQKWVQAYLKDDWRRFINHYLTQRDELRTLPRASQFYDVIAPEMIENYRKSAGIPSEEQEVLEHKYYNPSVPLPARLQPYANAAKLFPMPSEAIGSVNATAKPFLERLHKEYKYISGYNHAGLLKVQLLAMSDRRYTGGLDQRTKEIFYEKEVLLPAVWTSYTAGVCACTELLKFLSTNVDVIAALTLFWESLKDGSLLAKAMWELRGKSFFPPTI
jgi:hypothetical protein